MGTLEVQQNDIPMLATESMVSCIQYITKNNVPSFGETRHMLLPGVEPYTIQAISSAVRANKTKSGQFQ